MQTQTQTGGNGLAVCFHSNDFPVFQHELLLLELVGCCANRLVFEGVFGLHVLPSRSVDFKGLSVDTPLFVAPKIGICTNIIIINTQTRRKPKRPYKSEN